jgi:hypothetical protein
MAPDKTNWAPVPGGCTGPACDNPYEPTPQAREGPLGSKTLCNACGVHYSRYLRKQPANQVRGQGVSGPMALDGFQGVCEAGPGHGSEGGGGSHTNKLICPSFQ